MISARHVRRGTIQVRWVASIEDRDAPTVAELNAGTDLSEWVAVIDGFELERAPVPLTTDDETGQIISAVGYARPVSVPTLVLYDEGSATEAVRSALAQGTAGHVVICLDGAPVADDRAQVWPVVSCGPQHKVTAAIEAAMWSTQFALWAVPSVEAVIA